VHPGRDDHGADAECVRTRRARILHPGEGNTREADRARDGVAPDPLLAPEAAALGGDDPCVYVRGIHPFVDARDRGLEGALGHLLVALLEQLAELDHPGPYDRNPSFQCVAPEGQPEPVAYLNGRRIVRGSLHHKARSVVEVQHQQRQRRDERSWHGLVHHEGLDTPAA
jgi:hypothetical protein